MPKSLKIALHTIVNLQGFGVQLKLVVNGLVKMNSVNCGWKSEINYEIKKVKNKMKQQIKNTRYGRRCKQRLSSVLQYIYKITNKQAGALKHSSQIFWRLIAIVLMVAVTSPEFSTAIMPNNIR